MKICKKVLITSSFLAGFLMSALALAETPMTEKQAKEITFSNVCGTFFNAAITMEHAEGYAEWEPRRWNHRAKTDKLVETTTAICKASEASIKDALNSMKDKWYAQCTKEACLPSHSDNCGDNTFCDEGEVTVTGVYNSEECTYEVSNGQVQPQKLQNQTNERCFYGDGEEKGYQHATTSVPKSDTEAKFTMSLHCVLPGSVIDLKEYDIENDENQRHQEEGAEDSELRIQDPNHEDPAEGPYPEDGIDPNDPMR